MAFHLKRRLRFTDGGNTRIQVALERFAHWRKPAAHELGRTGKQRRDAPGRNKLKRFFQHLCQMNAQFNGLVAHFILRAHAHDDALCLVVRIPVGGNHYRGHAGGNRHTQALRSIRARQPLRHDASP